MAVFVVELDDKVSGPAGEAAAAVSHLADEMRKTDTVSSAAGDAQKSVASETEKSGEAAAETSKWFSDLTASGAATTDSMVGVKEMLGGVAEAASAAIVILSAYAAALWSAAKAAVGLTQQKEALASAFDVFTGGGGSKLLAELEDLSAELPFTSDRLNDWAKSLLAAGISGDRLKTSIRAIAAATAIMGEEGGRAAEGLIRRLEMTAAAGGKISIDRRFLTQLGAAGVSVQALAKQLGVAPEKLATMTVTAKQLGDAMQKALIAQGAGPLQKLGNTWESIRAKIVEGFEDAFEDLNDIVDPFMSELKSLASEFFAGGIASKDFAGVIKSILKPAFEIATNFVHFLHLNFLRLQVAILQVRVWLKPLTGVLDQIGVSAGIVNVALYILKGTCIVLAVVFGLLAVGVALVALPFIVAGLAIYGVVKGIIALVGVISGAIDHFDNLKAKVDETTGGILSSIASFVTGALTTLWNLPIDAVLIGGQFILGLVQAITTGQGPIADAVRALAATAINTIKGALGIKSPSRVMMGVGDNVTAGLVMGIQGGTPSVQGAAQGAGMAAVQGTVQGAQQAGGGASGDGGRKVEIHVEKGAIQINGAGDVLALTEEALATLLERVAAQAGLGVPQGA